MKPRPPKLCQLCGQWSYEYLATGTDLHECAECLAKRDELDKLLLRRMKAGQVAASVAKMRKPIEADWNQ